MSDSVAVSRLVQRRAQVLPADEEVEASDYGCFGWLRGVRDRAVMLELRRQTGDILAIGYGWLERVEFNPSEGIKLFVAGRTIEIRGRNLNGTETGAVSLYEGITRHRVPWVREARRDEQFVTTSSQCIVEAIRWS